MLKTTFILLTLILFLFHTNAEDANQPKVVKPIVIMRTSGCWQEKDRLELVIYEDGQALRRKWSEKEIKFSLYYTQIKPKELARIKKKLASLGDFSSLEKYYRSGPIYQDTEYFVSIDGKDYLTSILGGDFGNEKPIPKIALDLNSFFNTFNFPLATLWDPEIYEVTLSPYENASEESILWPKDFPDLKSPNTLKINNTYLIKWPRKDITKLTDYLKAKKEKGAIEIDGKKWSVTFKLFIPNEADLKNIINNVQEKSKENQEDKK